MAPSSLSSYPFPSNLISISLVSQDSFRTSLPLISLLPNHFSTLQSCPQKSWPGHLLPFHVTCVTPAPTSLYCLGESSSGTKPELHRALGIHPEAGVLLTLLPAPTPPAYFHSRLCSGTFKGSVSAHTVPSMNRNVLLALSLPVEFLASFWCSG